MQPPHPIVICDDGQATLADPRTRQAMHSRIGPERESQQIYVSGLDLEHGFRVRDAITIDDVGLGIAANALAVIDCALALGARCRARVVIRSFEPELTSLEQALDAAAGDPDRWQQLTRHASAARCLLSTGEWRSTGRPEIHWLLVGADYLEHARQPAFVAGDCVLYDLYSPDPHPEGWGVSACTTVARAMRAHPNAETELAPRLATYVSASAIRLTWLEAGLWVARGPGTARKRESTLISTSRAGLAALSAAAPLDRAWLERKGAAGHRVRVERLLREHAQFQST